MTESTLEALRAGTLKGATRLALRCGLQAVPPEVFTLADTLEVLDLSGNALHTLPDDLPRLQHLRVLFCSDNAFTALPAVLGRCPQLEMVGFKANRIAHVPPESLPPRLRWLILTDNRIAALPEALGACHRLQKLMLAGNRLRTLPEALARCTRLELLRLAANRFEALPPWLLQLPRLAWLAVAGNPLTAAREAATHGSRAAPRIDWRQLEVEALLGEGASGFIHAAHWRQPDGMAEPVALKLFKAAVTSDGWPASEMAATLAAGSHAGLIGLRGHLAGHPAGREGLVLARIDAGWRDLAGPPDFGTCTRDVYPPGTRLDAATVRHLAADVAAAVAHLHARGIVHGDLYAHNILWRPAAAGRRSQALLGDFGAAALPPDADLEALQRIEVRAFGCLLEELLAHGPNDAPYGLHDLHPLRDACLRLRVEERPDFAQLAEALR